MLKMEKEQQIMQRSRVQGHDQGVVSHSIVRNSHSRPLGAPGRHGDETQFILYKKFHFKEHDVSSSIEVLVESCFRPGRRP